MIRATEAATGAASGLGGEAGTSSPWLYLLALAGLAGIVLVVAMLAGLAWRRGALLAELAHGGAPVAPLTLVLGKGAGRVTADIWPAAGTARPARLLVYTPGSGGDRADNAKTAAGLAARGYLVAALDDVERDPAQAGAPAQLRFDFSSDAAFQRTLAGAEHKTSQQARRISEALDGLAALAASTSPPAWLRGVDVRRAGAFGWSMGGAAAAEASVHDRRIIAAANLDGWLFGAAARGAITGSYLLITSDYTPPGPDKITSADAAVRNEALLIARDLHAENRLIARPGNLALYFSSTVHEGFSDRILQPAYWRSWLKRDPVAMRRQIIDCLDSFFGASFAQPDGSGPDGAWSGCVGPGVQLLKEISWPDVGAAKAPRMSAVGAK